MTCPGIPVEVAERLKDRRRERLYVAYEEAANDPAYRAEMAELLEEFDCTTEDGLDED